MEQYQTIVVGLGAMGSAACHYLAMRGNRVLGLERFDIPHALGSSTGFSRMTRMSYFEHADYVPLLKSAWRLWHELEAQTGPKIFYATGGLYMGPEGGTLVGGALGAARSHQLGHELLSHQELGRRYPQFRVPGNFVGMLERDAGFIRPEAAIAAQASAALRYGAELHGREAVHEWFADSGGVTVVTSRGEYRGEKLILCGGAWSEKLVRDLGVPLQVTRQVMGWVWPKKPELFELGRLPVWAIDHLDGSIHYGFPISEGSPGFKLAHHGLGQAALAESVSREVTAADEQTIRPVLRENIPDADGPILSLRVCLYTNSPDQHFLIDRHPALERVYFACGFSGHGFKFAPVIGEALAELALTGKTAHPIAFLGLSRFRR
jgi:sarcosine oxidase